jgi:hypothetical protein
MSRGIIKYLFILEILKIIKIFKKIFFLIFRDIIKITLEVLFAKLAIKTAKLGILI